MITPEGIVIIVITVFFFIIALNIQVGWIYLLISILLSILIINLAYPWFTLGNIQVRRTYIGSCHEGEEAFIKISIKNTGKYGKYFFNIEDTFPASEKKESSIIFIDLIRAGHEMEVTYKKTAEKRGIYNFSPVRLTSRAPFGIFLGRKSLKDCGEKKLVVYPKLYKTGEAFLCGTEKEGLSEKLTRKTGHSMDFLGIREYRPGDSLRFIHWPSTARHNTFMIKEFEREASPPVTMLIDCNSSVQKGKGTESTFEYSLRFAATLAVHLNKKRSPFKIITFDREKENSSSPSIYEHLEHLAGLKGEGTMTVKESFQKIKPSGEVIIFTPDTSLSPYDIEKSMDRAGRVRILLLENFPEKPENVKSIMNSQKIKFFSYKKESNPEFLLGNLIGR